MHCIQSSDAHRLHRDPNDKNRLGVGDRVTEVYLPEPTFEALKELFMDSDFSRTRPFRPTQAPFDHVLAARQQGTNIVQSFHESMVHRGGHLYAILCDICAFANTNGGAVFVGLSDNAQNPVAGIAKPQEAIEAIRNEVEKKITPPLEIGIDVHETQAKKVLQISVPVGNDPPYVIDENKIYIRDETDSNLAVRDEIVALVKRSLDIKPEPAAPPAPEAQPAAVVPAPQNGTSPEPKTGVEIISVEERKGKNYYSLRDLRNGNIVHNVTRQSARKLWQYALMEHESHMVDPTKIEWHGDIGLWKKYKRGGQIRFDLLQRGADSSLHIYYGVTEDGIHGPWQKLIDTNDVA
jgi:hypothetical protein